MPECLRSGSPALVWALANDRVGNDVGLLLRGVRAGDDAGRREHVLHGAGDPRLRGLLCYLPSRQASLMHSGRAVQRGYAGLLG
jgi:hypothetical protein